MNNKNNRDRSMMLWVIAIALMFLGYIISNLIGVLEGVIVGMIGILCMGWGLYIMGKNDYE